MNQNEIIEMAIQGRTLGFNDRVKALEAFAELIAAKAFQNGYEKGIAAFNEAVLKEREACAKVADEYATWGGSNFYDWFKKLATAIRARGQA